MAGRAGAVADAKRRTGLFRALLHHPGVRRLPAARHHLRHVRGAGDGWGAAAERCPLSLQLAAPSAHLAAPLRVTECCWPATRVHAGAGGCPRATSTCCRWRWSWRAPRTPPAWPTSCAASSKTRCWRAETSTAASGAGAPARAAVRAAPGAPSLADMRLLTVQPGARAHASHPTSCACGPSLRGSRQLVCATRRVLYEWAPDVLVVTLKRFKQLAGGRATKDTRKVGPRGADVHAVVASGQPAPRPRRRQLPLRAAPLRLQPWWPRRLCARCAACHLMCHAPCAMRTVDSVDTVDYTERPCAPLAVRPRGAPHILRSWGTFCKVDPSQSPWPAPHAHAAQPKPRKTLLPCHHSDRRETGALGLDSKPPAWQQSRPPQQPLRLSLTRQARNL